MRKPSWRMGLVVLTIAGLAAPLFASLGRADIKWKMKPLAAGGVTAEVNRKAAGMTGPPACFSEVLPPGSPAGGMVAGDQFGRFCVGAPGNYVVTLVGMDAFGVPYMADWCLGDAEAGGGLGTSSIEAVPDSLIAGMGLYKSGGGTTLIPPPGGSGSIDSVMSISFARAAGQVTVGMPHGGMQTRSTNYHERSLSSLTLIVYRTPADADADVNSTGAGAIYYSKIILKAGPDREFGGSSFQIHPRQGANPPPQVVSPSDLVLVNEGGGKLTLRPADSPNHPGPLSKVLSAAGGDHSQATLVVIDDPRSVDAVPATSPIGLVVLALALTGSGLWTMIRLRQKSVAA